MGRKTVTGLVCAGLGFALAVPAFAQGNPASAEPPDDPTGTQGPRAGVAEQGDFGDIVITARRRAEPLQETPLAVTAISGDRLDEARVRNLSDLQTLAPSVSLSRDSVNSSRIIPFIRGFGSKSADMASEPAVAITIDGIYIGSQLGNYVNLFDVEAVEVLRGPQGILLGKNAPAGGIAIRTRRPSGEFRGMAQVDYGRFEDLQVQAYLDMRLVPDKLAATISYFRRHSDGYIRNIVTGEDVGGLDTQTVRLAFLATPTDYLTWYLTGSYEWDRGEDSPGRNVSDFTPLTIPTANYPVVPPPITITCTNAFSRHLCTNGTLPNLRPYTTQGNLPDRNHSSWNVTSNLDIAAGPVNFAAVTGFRKTRERGQSDIDGTFLPIFDSFPVGNAKQFSQELRVASGDGTDLNGRLSWLFGGYYFYQEYRRFSASVGRGVPNTSDQHQILNSYALFGYAEYELFPEFKISAGARQTWDQKDHDSRSATFYRGGADTEVVESGSWKNFSIEAGASYQFTPRNMIFFRYAEGYRGGGFTGIPALAVQASSFDPETVQSYEIGTKNDFFNRRLRVNLTLFRADYSDLQRVISTNVPFPPFFTRQPRNIASARTDGFELEMLAQPVRDLTLRGSVGYVDARYTDYVANLTGVAANGVSDNRDLKFPYISKWTAAIGATYVASLGASGSLTFVTDFAYRSTLNFTDQEYAFATQPGYGLLSGSITWTDARERFSLVVYGQNLTNKRYLDGGDAVGDATSWVIEGAPRTWGVSARVRF